jgi:hypothetical protein
MKSESYDEQLRQQEAARATDESVRINRHIDQHAPWLTPGQRVAEFFRQSEKRERGIKD